MEAAAGDDTEPGAELGKAVDQFNRQQFWECHETLEGLWLPGRYPLRLFYQGLIKSAVGLFHLEKHNRRGAELKLGEALYTLAPFCPRTMGIEVDRLRNDLTHRSNLIRAVRLPVWETLERLPPALFRGTPFT